MGARCEAHGLAVAADGSCVVCRREASIRAVAPRPRSGWLVAVLVCSGLVAISVGATALSIALPVPTFLAAPASTTAPDPLTAGVADTPSGPVEAESPPTNDVTPPPEFAGSELGSV